MYDLDDFSSRSDTGGEFLFLGENGALCRITFSGTGDIDLRLVAKHLGVEFSRVNGVNTYYFKDYSDRISRRRIEIRHQPVSKDIPKELLDELQRKGYKKLAKGEEFPAWNYSLFSFPEPGQVKKKVA